MNANSGFTSQILGGASAVGLTAKNSAMGNNASTAIGISDTGGTFNGAVLAGDSFITGVGTAVNVGVLTLNTYASASTTGVRITNATINLKADTTGGLTSTTTQPAFGDSSTSIPTTAWVQSAIVSNVKAIPFFQISGNYVGTQVSAPYYSLRGAQIQFGFIGGNWAINDFFTLRITYSSAIAATAVISDSYTQWTMYCDVYPNRCPVNSGSTNGAYGDSQNSALNLVTNQPLFNNSIWNGTAYVSTYVAPIVATYNPAGRWFWTNNFTSNVPAGASIVPSNLNVIQPYAINGTPAAGGFGINILDLYPRNGYKQFFDVSIELVNRGIPGGAITLTTSSLPSGVTVNKSGW